MNDPYQKIIESLKSRKKILLSTHVRPDGDALGSTGAMHLALKKIGVNSDILLLSHLPTKYEFLYKDYGISFIDVENSGLAKLDLNEYDAMLLIDTGTWSQLPGLREKLAGWDKPKWVIDHHMTQENWADEKIVLTQAAAAGEIVAEIIEQMDIEFDTPIAVNLFVAIITDTGWFQFSNTRPFTLRLCARLMEAGVDTDKIYQHIYQNERPQRVALQTRAMQSITLLANGKLAVMKLSKQDFTDTGANVPDTENMINIPLQIADVQASILAVEPKDFGPIRISLRSKGAIDVAKLAEQFGGGGHKRASGLKLEGTLDQATQKVADAVIAALG
jgi:bifunctional oligoribonuclease and PAP phosphatase NrnA